MKVSLSLLKKFLHLNLPLETMDETLTCLGIEVDAILHKHPPFAKLVVGEVLSTEKHPQAEKLTIAQVCDGKQVTQVVCGAPNCRKGMKTPFAPVGAMIVDADGKQRIIEATEIRSIPSFGMLCSASELQLWNDPEGILELPLDWENGKDLALLLWDPVFELSLTPNLGHCLSALGIARELSAALQIPLHKMEMPHALKPQKGTLKPITVDIENFNHCPKYTGRLIEDVQIAPSPFWLQKELLACGIKPICNVVDATNYIMIKNGQPLHAFDYDQIKGKHLSIRMNPTKQIWMGLDDVEREIPPGILSISDEEGILAIAGVLGGKRSAVSKQTQHVFLEAAFFEPTIIQKGAKKLSLRTDSAIRFEKGIDPQAVASSLDEAAALIAEIANGQVSATTVHLDHQTPKRKIISLRISALNRLLGSKLSISEVESILKRLHCSIQHKSEDHLDIVIPSYRFDLEIEVDLIEEVARIYGYNHLRGGSSKSIPSKLVNDPSFVFENKIRDCCTKLGLQEFLTSDLISPKLASLAVEWAGKKEMQLLKTLHAKTEDYSILRPSLLPGLLQVAQTNLSLKNQTFHGFEIGRAHFLEGTECVEVPMLSFILTGKARPIHFSSKEVDIDFYTLKGLIENLMHLLHIEAFQFTHAQHLSFHPGRQAELRSGPITIGSIGEIHPLLTRSLGIKQPLLFAELDLVHLLSLHREKVRYQSIPQYPSSQRDWTLSLSDKESIQPIFESIERHRPSILEHYELIDLYQEPGKAHQNFTLRFTYRDPLKTLSFEEVDQAHHTLIKNTH